MGYTVALTGGIGSGKSTIAEAFARRGIVVVDADTVARQVVEPGMPALNKIAEYFGPEMISNNGSLNRQALRERIFAIPQDKQWLNTLLHPLIGQLTTWQINAATSPYVLWVVPLLVENALHTKADRILVVDVSPETQVVRTMARDNVSRAQALQIINAQVTRDARLSVADDIINNESTIKLIDENVERLHQLYLMLSQTAAQEKK